MKLAYIIRAAFDGLDFMASVIGVYSRHAGVHGASRSPSPAHGVANARGTRATKNIARHDLYISDLMVGEGPQFWGGMRTLILSAAFGPLIDI